MGTLYFRVVTEPTSPFTTEGMSRWPDTPADPTMEQANAPNPNPRPVSYDDQLRDEGLSFDPSDL